MSALFITDRWPVPLSQFRHGTALRMRMLLRALQRVDPVVHLLLLSPLPQPWSQTQAEALRAEFATSWGVSFATLRAAFPGPDVGSSGPLLWSDYIRPALSLYNQSPYERVSGAPHVEALRLALRELAPSLLFVHRLPAMGLVRRSGAAVPPMVFDLDDIEHKAFERIVRQPPQWRTKQLFLLQVPALRRMESWAIQHANTTLVCSDLDARELSGAYPHRRIKAIPNTVPTPPAQPLPGGKTVLFLGVYGYEPNRVAAELLVHQVWPRVRAQHPDARLLIAGKRCEAIAGFEQPPEGVSFLGFVDDLDALYAQTQIVACPILSGGGTRIKIIEGALRGRPVVSTTIGAEGLDLRPAEEEIVIADGVPAFSQALVDLLSEPLRAQRIGKAGQARAFDLYDEVSVTNSLVSEIQEAAAAGDGRRA